MDCIFCKIVDGQIPAKIVYEDDKAIAFEDVNPQAPVHVLIIPRKHISTILDIEEEDKGLIGHMYSVGNEIAKRKNIDSRGFRSVMNCNEDGGQAVFHLHLHILGGRSMQWPPG
ncbi:MAG: histidine triad nucleotide-binding protein [Nitrospirota bacterium]|nr:MAG: histidine triad nucleotide-binding protein [Nitrospirota bacterium]